MNRPDFVSVSLEEQFKASGFFFVKSKDEDAVFSGLVVVAKESKEPGLFAERLKDFNALLNARVG